jgi:uncharacterized protein YcbX
MLVDENGIFMTQRIHPRMALFKLSIEGEFFRIVVTPPGTGAEPVSVKIDPAAPPSGEVVKARIWDDEVTVIETDKSLSEWFSNALQLPCRLVCFPEPNPRRVDFRFRVDDENVSLADAYPYMIIGESSLSDLNKRLKEPVPMNRFRPNFVFAGGEPYEEDTWRNFRIGDNRFIGIRPCARCVVTTVNQDTAHKGVEPLYTLSNYRKKDNKVLFGQNVIAVDYGSVNEGDPIVLT